MSETRESLHIDLGPHTMDRLRRLKSVMEAASYAEVIKAALRSLEREIPHEIRPTHLLASSPAVLCQHTPSLYDTPSALHS